jgi:hypothetical protein
MIVIPSHRRCDSLAAIALAWLASTDVPLSEVVVVVSDEADRAEYSARLPVRVVLPPQRQSTGLTDKLNAIHYGMGDRELVLLEDDIVVCGDDRKPITKLQRVLDEGAEAIAGGGLWGVASSSNPFFYGRPGAGFRFIAGFIWGSRGNADPELACTVPVKADYERTCRYYRRFGTLHRVGGVGAKAKASYALAGGIQANHTHEARQVLERQAVLDLCQAFPHWLAPNEQRKSGFPELRLLKAPASAPAYPPAPLEAWPCGWLL